MNIQRTRFIFKNKRCSQILKNFFVQHNVIPQNQRLRFSYSGSGDFSEVLKFNVGKKKYALKIFSNDKFLENINSIFGNGAEQNNALYINADEKSDWVKFYFGNIFDKYMITKYINSDNPLPEKIMKLSDKGLQYIDYSMKNIKNNTGLDYGGHEKIEDFPVGNKVAMWTIKKLKALPPEKRIEEIEKIKADKKVPNYYDRMIGIKYLKTHILPKDEKFIFEKHGFWHSLINAFLGMYKD